MNVDDYYRLRTLGMRLCRRVAAEMAPEGATRVLDAACGTGLLFRETNACTGAVRVCLDKSPEFLAHVPDDCVPVVGDLLDPPDLPGPFDVIFLLNTIYNLGGTDTAVKAVGSLSRLLAPGGIILADIRNPAHPILRLRYLMEKLRGRFVPTAHSLKKMRRALARRGLRVRRARPIGWLIPFGYVLEVVLAEDGEE